MHQQGHLGARRGRYTANVFFCTAQNAYVANLEAELSSVVGFDVSNSYDKQKLIDCEDKVQPFCSNLFDALWWHDEGFLATRARLPHLDVGLAERTLALIKADNPGYKHRSWKRGTAAAKYSSPAGTVIGSEVKKNVQKGKSSAAAKGEKKAAAAAAPKAVAPKLITEARVILPVCNLPQPLAKGAKAARAAEGRRPRGQLRRHLYPPRGWCFHIGGAKMVSRIY